MNPLNAKVLFVQSGIPFYYSSLEMSIYNALQKVVQAVIMVSSKETIKTAIKTKPDFILVLHGLHPDFNHDIIPMLKRYGYKTGIWLTDDPYYSDFTQHIVQHYDYVFTQDVGIINFYQELGCNH
ncbi:TPA: spore maturation protein, partial [Bacillus cereus]|nr:spore maturation protein [Bacillus cereus]